MRYRDYLARPAWKRRRAWHLRWAHYTCALCGKPGADTVHHVSYEHRGNERHSELMALHAACHEELHQWFAPPLKGWNTPKEGVSESGEGLVRGAQSILNAQGGTCGEEVAIPAPLTSSQLITEADYGVW